jgi:chorismate mutase
MATRGVRGAISVTADLPEEILTATREMLSAMLAANPGLRVEEIGAAIFSVTEDIRSVFPAQAAREMGWKLVPMMCAGEIPVPDSLPYVIRVLILWNTDQKQSEIQHVYLGKAASLRPDLVEAG